MGSCELASASAEHIDGRLSKMAKFKSILKYCSLNVCERYHIMFWDKISRNFNN